MDRWHDIKDIGDFEENYKFNDYVVFVKDEDDDEYTDIAFGIALFPSGVKRFFCVPYDDNQGEQ